MEATSKIAPPAARLCKVATSIVGVAGAGVMLMAGELPQGSLCTSDHVSNLIEELQYSLGEGPYVDAYRRSVAGPRAGHGHHWSPLGHL